MKKSKIIEGVAIFFLALLFAFLLIYGFLEPFVQDAYNKGYLRGRKEGCYMNFSSIKKSPFYERLDIKTNISINVS